MGDLVERESLTKDEVVYGAHVVWGDPHFNGTNNYYMVFADV